MTKVEKLRELLAKASPRPWVFGSVGITERGDIFVPSEQGENFYKEIVASSAEKNAPFICELVNNADALLRVVEAAHNFVDLYDYPQKTFKELEIALKDLDK